MCRKSPLVLVYFSWDPETLIHTDSILSNKLNAEAFCEIWNGGLCLALPNNTDSAGLASTVMRLELHCGNLVDFSYTDEAAGYDILCTAYSKLSWLLSFFKLNSLFRLTFMDFSLVDVTVFTKRFLLVYFLNCLAFSYRFSILFTSTEFFLIPSAQSLFAGSGWSERECWDMFGSYFTGQYNLWRLLSDYGFTGFPLRKDFPLTGFFEVSYDEKTKRLTRSPVELSQEFRLFSLNKGWSGHEHGNGAFGSINFLSDFFISICKFKFALLILLLILFMGSFFTKAPVFITNWLLTSVSKLRNPEKRVGSVFWGKILNFGRLGWFFDEPWDREADWKTMRLDRIDTFRSTIFPRAEERIRAYIHTWHDNDLTMYWKGFKPHYFEDLDEIMDVVRAKPYKRFLWPDRPYRDLIRDDLTNYPWITKSPKVAAHEDFVLSFMEEAPEWYQKIDNGMVYYFQSWTALFLFLSLVSFILFLICVHRVYPFKFKGVRNIFRSIKRDSVVTYKRLKALAKAFNKSRFFVNWDDKGKIPKYRFYYFGNWEFLWIYAFAWVAFILFCFTGVFIMEHPMTFLSWIFELNHRHLMSIFDTIVTSPKHPTISMEVFHNLMRFIFLFFLVRLFYMEMYNARFYPSLTAVQEMHWWWVRPQWATWCVIFFFFVVCFLWHFFDLEFFLAPAWILSSLPFNVWISIVTASFFPGFFILYWFQRQFFRNIVKKYRIKEWSRQDHRIIRITWLIFWFFQITIFWWSVAWGFTWYLVLLQYYIYHKAFQFYVVYEYALSEKWKRFVRRKRSLNQIKSDPDVAKFFLSPRWYLYWYHFRLQPKYLPGLFYLTYAGADWSHVASHLHAKPGEEWAHSMNMEYWVTPEEEDPENERWEET